MVDQPDENFLNKPEKTLGKLDNGQSVKMLEHLSYFPVFSILFFTVQRVN